MKKSFFGFFGFVLVFMFLFIGYAGVAQAEINVNINIGSPPVLVAEPELVYMSGFGIYFVSGASYDVFFYDGFWWSPRGDRWYRAGQYKGPWVMVKRNYVPGHLFKVPKNYRAVYKKVRPIKYKEFQKKIKQKSGSGHKK